MTNLRYNSKLGVERLEAAEIKMLFDFLALSTPRHAGGQSAEDGILHSLAILFRRNQRQI